MKIFGIEKFKGLLLAGSFTVLANYFVRLSDSIVAGNMIGPDALAGINLVSPILAGVSFFSGLVSAGSALTNLVLVERRNFLNAELEEARGGRWMRKHRKRHGLVRSAKVTALILVDGTPGDNHCITGGQIFPSPRVHPTVSGK